jgi:hypothetical protein
MVFPPRFMKQRLVIFFGVRCTFTDTLRGPSSAKPCVAVLHSLWLRLHSNVGKFVGVFDSLCISRGGKGSQPSGSFHKFI